MFRFVGSSILALGAVVVAATASHAQVSPSDFSFAVGQIAGSSTACGVVKDDINAVASKAFAKLKIELKEGDDNFKRFVAGFADGAKQVKDGAAKCEDVKAGFAAFGEKVK